MPDRSGQFDEIGRLISAIAVDLDPTQEPPLTLSEHRIDSKPNSVRVVVLLTVMCLVGLSLFSLADKAAGDRRRHPAASVAQHRSSAIVPRDPATHYVKAEPSRPLHPKYPNKPRHHEEVADRLAVVAKASPPSKSRLFPARRGTVRSKAGSVSAGPSPVAASEGSVKAVHLTGTALEMALADDHMATQRLNAAELAKIEKKR